MWLRFPTYLRQRGQIICYLAKNSLQLLVILDDIPERSLEICGRLARLVRIIRQWSITHFSGSVWTQTPVLRIVATEYLHDRGYHVFLHL